MPASAKKNFNSLGFLPSSTAQLLGAILILLIGVPLTLSMHYAEQIHGVLFSAVYITSLLAVGKNRSTLVNGSLLLIPALAARWSNEFIPGLIPHYIIVSFALILLVYVTIHILLFIIKAPRVNPEVIYAGISAYLMLGVSAALAYVILSEITPEAFMRNATHISSPLRIDESLYFSFITMATVGYGDITPSAPLLRTFAYLQSVMGTFYMAILIARLVAKYSSESYR